MASGLDVLKGAKDDNWARAWSWVDRVSFHKMGMTGGGMKRKRRVLC